MLECVVILLIEWTAKEQRRCLKRIAANSPISLFPPIYRWSQTQRYGDKGRGGTVARRHYRTTPPLWTDWRSTWVILKRTTPMLSMKQRKTSLSTKSSFRPRCRRTTWVTLSVTWATFRTTESRWDPGISCNLCVQQWKIWLICFKHWWCNESFCSKKYIHVEENFAANTMYSV